MQRLTLSIPVASFLPGDRFAVFANIDANGCPLEAIDYARPLNGRTPFWPLTPAVPGWGEQPWGEGPWGDVPAETPGDHAVLTPALYFGRYRFAVKTYDALGNASAGTPEEFEATVNSGPRQAQSFRQTDVAEDGRPVFSFVPPAQIR